MHLAKAKGLVLLPALLCLTTLSVAATQHARFDPATEDPPVDRDHPAAMLQLELRSHGSRLDGVFYLAQGKGPHPTVVLLHGFPGYEQNLDLAHAVRRAGWNVLVFHYRGSWGSEGSYSLRNALEDVPAAIEFVRSELAATNERVSPHEFVLVGHSLGGFLSLMTASSDPSIVCAASIAGVDLGRRAKAIGNDTEMRQKLVSILQSQAAPLSGFSGEAMVDDILSHADAYDLVEHASELASHRLFLAAGERDQDVPIEENHAPLVEALGRAGARNVTSVVLDADHAFSDKRIALARALISWLQTSCRSEEANRPRNAAPGPP